MIRLIFHKLLGHDARSGIVNDLMAYECRYCRISWRPFRRAIKWDIP
jgi:hypothetical protein